MKATEFCYWLQGFFELRAESGACAEPLTNGQTLAIQRHLALVFKHEIDPSYGADPKVQADMQATHDGTCEPDGGEPPAVDPNSPPKPKRPPPRPPLGQGVVFRC